MERRNQLRKWRERRRRVELETQHEQGDWKFGSALQDGDLMALIWSLGVGSAVEKKLRFSKIGFGGRMRWRVT